MKSVVAGLLVVSLCLFSLTSRAADAEPSQINVGYFKGWPTPNQFAQIKQAYDTALELKLNWIAFDNGFDMNQALASGELEIAFAHGHVPFILGVTSGLPLTMVGIAVAYPENDLCIVHRDSGINSSNAQLLEGRKVATLIGNQTHYRMLRVLTHLKVDITRLEIMPVKDGAAAAAALQSGAVDMACAYGGALRSMAELGSPLLSGAEQEKIGLKIFDIVTVATAFMDKHPEIVQAFMDVTEASNQQWKKNPASMLPAIARAAQMNREGARQTMSEFHFPSAAEQKTEGWMGALVADYSLDLARFFVVHGQLEKSLESYQPFITTRFLR